MLIIILELFLVVPGILTVRYFVYLFIYIKPSSINLTCNLNLQFEQHDYSITFERVQVAKYNKEYLKSAKTVTYKYNRTQAAVNGTFEILKDLGNDVEVRIFSYGLPFVCTNKIVGSCSSVYVFK